MGEVCRSVWGTSNGKLNFGGYLLTNPFQWNKFVEKRSLLSSEHCYFANIYTQKGLTLGGGATSCHWWGKRRGFCPPSYIVEKGSATKIKAT